MSGLAKAAGSSPSLFPIRSSENLFEKGKPIDEVRRKRLQKVYEEYYQHYNKLLRPIQEKEPERQIKGLASWSERALEDSV